MNGNIFLHSLRWILHRAHRFIMILQDPPTSRCDIRNLETPQGGPVSRPLAFQLCLEAVGVSTTFQAVNSP